MQKILLVRLSAMGDVAMLIPTVYALAEANSNCQITFLTQPFFAKLMIDRPNNLSVKTIDIRGKQANFIGLLQYLYGLRKESYDLVIDFHNVIRTKLLRFVLGFLSSCRTIALKKPRQERASFLKHNGQEPEAVPPMLELYLAILKESGLILPTDIKPLSISITPVKGDLFFYQKYSLQEDGLSHNIKDMTICRIGIAPFASTDSKTYDESYMQELIALLSSESNSYVYLFGAPGKEATKLKSWAENYDNVLCLSGDIKIDEELKLIAGLDCMLSMDSSNAHLASMLGVHTLTLWCATHPKAGFKSFGQLDTDCLVPEDLACQPCSIFGVVKSCPHKEMVCRKAISPMLVMKHIKSILPNKLK